MLKLSIHTNQIHSGLSKCDDSTKVQRVIIMLKGGVLASIKQSLCELTPGIDLSHKLIAVIYCTP